MVPLLKQAVKNFFRRRDARAADGASGSPWRPDGADCSTNRILWVAATPLCALALAVMWAITGHFIPETCPANPNLLVSRWYSSCRPEPLEQSRYVLSLALTFVVLWAAAVYARRRAAGEAASLWDAPAAGLAARVVQWLLAALVFAAVVYQEKKVYPYLGPHWLNEAVVALILTGLAWRLLPRRVAAGEAAPVQPPARPWSRIAARTAPWALALLCTVWELLHTLVWDRRLVGAACATLTHLPFQMGEFGAVLDGRTPMVDFFPQYQNCLSYLLEPVFRVIGLNPMTFTTAMAVLSAVLLLTVFGVLRRFTGDGWKALVLYVPLLWATFTPCAVVHGGDFEARYGAFSYFAVGPLRYFGPCLTLGCLAWYLSRPSRWRLLVLFITAGWAAINNLDFGVPALVGALLGALLSTDGGPLPRLGAAVRVAGGAAVGVGLAVAAFGTLTLARSGRLPDWWTATSFQRAFAVNGFAMLPMPAFGLHWAFFLTFMAAIARGLFDRAASRLRKGLLLFGGVFGSGAMMYYVGRSHPHVLIAVFLAWAFPFLLLTWMSWEDALARFRAGGWARALTAPLVLLTLGYGALVARFEERPNLWEQVSRLKPRRPPGYPEDPAWAQDCQFASGYLRAHAAPGEKVVLTLPYGHVVARQAGVHNVFPFTNWGSLILRSQLDVLGEVLRRNNIRHAFGECGIEEFNLTLARHGFRRRWVDGGVLWTRQDDRPAPYYEWGKGFYAAEVSGAGESRWADASANLVIHNTGADTERLTLRMCIAAARPTPALLRLKCGADVLEQKLASGAAEFVLECTAPPGDSTVQFTCDGKPLDAPGDPRSLVFRVITFEASERAAEEWPGRQP